MESPFCDICADPGIAGVCRNCLQEAATSSESINAIRTPFLMEGLLREGVHSFKYRNNRAAAPVLASLLANYLRDNPLPGNVLLPVPLHRKRLRERGYNQAALLASELGKRLDMPVSERILVRTRHASPQASSTSSAQRRANTEAAFICGDDASGMSVILVDDVCTTGATLRACAEALRESGAESVCALALARERLHSTQQNPQ